MKPNYNEIEKTVLEKFNKEINHSDSTGSDLTNAIAMVAARIVTLYLQGLDEYQK